MTTLWTNRSLRELERSSIYAFLHSNRQLLAGRTLDFGCGQQRYRDLVEAAGGVYLPYDRARFAANVSGSDIGTLDLEQGYDAIICTQVVQYVDDVAALFDGFNGLLDDGAVLLATGPTCWPIVEPEDLHRHTPGGITALLRSAGFVDVNVQVRAEMLINDLVLPIGWQCVAYA